MPDTSMPMPDNEQDEPIQVGDELPVKLDTMMVGGERPEVDDQVEVTVSGRVTRIIDDCAYVALEKANNEEIESKTPPQEADLRQMSEQMDQTASSPISGDY